VLIAALVVLTEAGPGKASLDRQLGQERSGVAWGLGVLGLGAAASTAAIEVGRRAAPSSTAPLAAVNGH